MADNRYIVGSTQGWLRVKREPGGQILSLPEFLQVEVTESKQGRDYFKVTEGPERGKAFSVVTGNLRAGNAGYQPAASIQFSLSKKVLTYQATEVGAFTDEGNPIAQGVHPIQIPDFPHEYGQGYLSKSSYALSWFYLGRGHAVAGNNDRYLHPGQASAGCITVDPASWTKLYQYLILCRSGDGQMVGSVTVQP